MYREMDRIVKSHPKRNKRKRVLTVFLERLDRKNHVFDGNYV